MQTHAVSSHHEVNFYRSNLAQQARQPAMEFIPMRALLLEGSPQTRATYEHIFKDLGFEDIEIAENFSEAFRHIEIKHEPFDLIVLDQCYWGDDKLSLKLCELIRSNPEYAHTAIVMLSNSCDSDEVEAAFRAGVDEFIPKYLHPLELKRLAWNAVFERRYTHPSF